MEISLVRLIRPPGVLSMPKSCPGESDIGLQNVYCWEVGLYDDIWRLRKFIPHYMEVTPIFIFRNTDFLLTNNDS